MGDEALFECFFALTLSNLSAPISHVDCLYPPEYALPDNLLLFLLPEVVSRYASETFFFALGTGETQLHCFCHRIVFSASLCSCSCVLSKRCWPSLFHGLLCWDVFFESVTKLSQGLLQAQKDLGSTSPALFKKLLQASVPGPGRAYKVSLPESTQPLVFRIPRSRCVICVCFPYYSSHCSQLLLRRYQCQDGV